MKQTRAALTMLLSAYRSIFANSYLKGLACGVIAASALAAGSASAADLSGALASSPDEVTAENAVTAGSDSDTLSSGGYAYSLTVGSGYGLTVSSEVEVADGGAAVNGILTLASGASLTVALNNNYTYEDYYSLALYNDIFQLSSSAVSLGSGTISVADGATFTLGAGIYDLTGIDIENAGSIVVDQNATVFLSDVEALEALGSVDIIEKDDDETAGRVVLTAARSYIDTDLFASDKVHASVNSGNLMVKELYITSTSLDTQRVELESNGDAYLTVDDNTFTVEGHSKLGIQNGNVYLVDEDGNPIENGTILLAGHKIWFGNYDFSGTDQTYRVNADFVLDTTGHDGELSIDFGTYVLQDVTINNGSFVVGDIDEEDTGYGDAEVTLGTLTLNPRVGDSASVTIASNGSVTATSVNASSGSIAVNGTLSVEGDGSGSTVDLALYDTTLTLGSSGTLKLNDAADTIGLSFTSGSFKVASEYSQISSLGGTIEADLSEVVSDELTYDQANSLFDLLTSDSSTGLVKIDGANVQLNTTSSEYGAEVVSASDVENCTFYTDSTLETIVTGVSGSITGGWKAVVLDDDADKATVSSGGTLIIAGSTSSGNLVETADGSAASLSLEEGANATLTGTGSIGSISGVSATLTVSSGAQVSVETLEDETSAVKVGTLSVSDAGLSATGSVDADSLEVSNATLEVSGDLTTSDLSASAAQITTQNLTLSSSDEGAEINAESSIKVTGTAKINQDITLIDNSSLTVATMEVAENATVQVGREGEENGTGILEVETMDLKGGNLILDPDFGQATAMAAVQSFTEKVSSDEDLQVLNGNVIVGKNSALGVGMTLAELQSFVSAYQVNGSLVEDSDYASITVINTSGIEIAEGSQLVLGTSSITDLQSELTESGNSIYFGDGASLFFTAASLVDDEDSATGTLHFAADEATLYAAGGQIVVPAGITSTQLEKLITASSTSEDEDGVTVSVSDAAAEAGVEGLYFTTYNGLYTGVLTDDQSLSDLVMTLSDNSRSILSGLSNPMYNFVIETFGTTGTDFAGTGTGAAFLQDAISLGNGGSAETAARLAVFGGAVQAAYLVEQEAANAIRSRAGFTAASNLTVAENNGFGLWLLPVYRYLDASGFNAGGLDAGAEINLYGVSLGADYAFADTARVGLMFSVGTGDSDGKDAGSKVNNDFDYYSAGLYAVINPVENFDILARLTYSEVDNDLDASSGMSDYGTLKASTDSSALSFGVEARYTFKTGLVDIAPHLGLTYTKLKLDDYEVGSAQGSILKSDNDNLDVFSIPLGVKFSSSLSAGDWSISPAADLHVAFNAGDDELDSDVTFKGLDRKVALSAEVLDEFTYGIDLGISAQYQSLRLGLQVGYEGSDNTDAFGVMGNVSYIF